MPQPNRAAGWMLGCAIAAVAGSGGTARAQDWPQFRGANRDAKVAGFTVPATWPKTLNQKWKINVGDGVSTPALVGDKLFVFSRLNNNEVTRCLDAATGKELWQDKYPAAAVNGPAGQYSGPRSSPTVADGKVVTCGVHGTLSCLDAVTGKLLWRKDEFRGSEPKFSVSSSPLVVDGVCIAQLGGQGNGGIVAYQLATGEQKWKWTGDSPANASPALMTIGDDKLIIAETDGNVVAVRAADGKEVWRTPFGGQGPGVYNAASPVVDGQTLIYSGGNRGTHAVRIEKTGDTFAGKEIWKSDKGVQFASPVVKDGLYYGLSGQNELFCLSAETGKLAWAQSLGGRGGPGGGGFGGGGQPGGNRPGGLGQPGGGPPGGGGGFGGGRPGRPGGMRGGGGGGMGGYGSIVDAGSVLLALTPASELIAFAPGDKQYTEQARIKVAETPTYAYPVLSGNRVLIKDKDSLRLWTVE